MAKIRTDISSRSVAEEVGEQDRQRVRLLAGGAAGRPEAQLVAALAGLADDIGQDLVAQVVEQLRVAEEVGHLDQEAADQALVLLRVALEVGGVLLDRVLAGVGHAALQAAPDRRLAVAEKSMPLRSRTCSSRARTWRSSVGESGV